MKILLPLFLMLSVCTHAVAQNTGAHDGATNPNPEKIETYIPRFGRLKPVIAVVTDAVGTELSDAIVPFGILSASNLADVHLVIKTPGIVNFTALKAQVDTSFDMFDKQFPDGADYIIIPAILSKTDPALINWLRAQGSKGSSLVSICDGSFVLAETGLMNGHRATGHWGSEQRRIQKYSQVKWEKNIRFVADGKIVSSSGISAAIPTSIALVEAIGGYQNALVLANQVGVTEWSSRHNSDIFQGSPMDPPAPGESLGLPLTGGVDEVAYALTADAYSFTRLSSVFSLAADTKPVRSKHGLMIIPDRVIGGIDPVDFVLPEISKIPVIRAFENALEEIEKRYGEDVAKKVAIFMEYPWKK